MENVKQDTNIGTNILRVSASDEDADNNGAIRYSLTAPADPSDLDYFDIQPESGWIFLTKPLDVSHFTKFYHDIRLNNIRARPIFTTSTTITRCHHFWRHLNF